jgi:hypothetical protein
MFDKTTLPLWVLALLFPRKSEGEVLCLFVGFFMGPTGEFVSVLP